MKKLLLIIVVVIISSFCTRDSYPCHYPGDPGACAHRMHSYDYDRWGYTYPCSHPVHNFDYYPCIHTCY